MDWFETKVEREIKENQYDPEYIKLKVLSEMKFFPEENEQFDIRGGLGNSILKQLKCEEGIIYERDNPNDKWGKSNMEEYMNRFFKMLDVKC